jgi:hypothetical protein
MTTSDWAASYAEELLSPLGGRQGPGVLSIRHDSSDSIGAATQ